MSQQFSYRVATKLDPTRAWVISEENQWRNKRRPHQRDLNTISGVQEGLALPVFSLVKQYTTRWSSGYIYSPLLNHYFPDFAFCFVLI